MYFQKEWFTEMKILEIIKSLICYERNAKIALYTCDYSSLSINHIVSSTHPDPWCGCASTQQKHVELLIHFLWQ